MPVCSLSANRSNLMSIDRTGSDAPQFRLLSEDKIRSIDDASLRVLEEVGLQVAHKEARDLLVGAGAILEDEALVKVPRSLVKEALETAPGSFTIYDRNGEEALHLGVGKTYYGAGVTNLAYMDIDGERRDFTLPDIADVAFLSDALPNIDFVAQPGVVRPSQDMRVELVNHLEFFEMVTHTTMPLVVLLADGPTLADVYEMADAVVGGRDAFCEKPFVVPYLNPVSPLLFNPDTVDKLFLAADRDTPVVVQSAPPVGGSSPVTVVSGLVVSAAESLMGLVLSQLRNPGSPFITGVVPFVMDMRSGNTAATGPDMLKMMIAMGELAHFWGIPSLGVGGGGDAKLPDEQAAFDCVHFSQGVVLGGVDMSFDAGCLECGLLFSPEVLVFADEAIGMHKRFAEGLHVDDATIALDVIKEVGPGGFFLGHQHTRDYFRELWEPTLTSWEPRDMWEERGSKTMGDRARDRVAGIRAEHSVPPLPDAVLTEMREIITRREALLEDED